MPEKVLLFERKLPPRTLSTCVLCNCSGWTGYIKNSNISKIVDNLRKHPGCWGWDLPLTLAHKGGGDLLLQAPHKPPLFRTPPNGGDGGSNGPWILALPKLVWPIPYPPWSWQHGEFGPKKRVNATRDIFRQKCVNNFLSENVKKMWFNDLLWGIRGPY